MSVAGFKYFLFCSFLISANVNAQTKTIKQKVDSVIKLMTLEEKIGQLNQYSGDWAHTGPITADGDKQNQIKKGQVGSMLNVMGVEHTRELQQMAMQSRLKIPLLFGQDVIHGFRTTFPIPLAQSCSWNIPLIENAERVAANEASAYGIHWTFSPMVDIARDARWGRVMEGSGEDPFLGAKISAARVRGFQGKGIGNNNAVMACVKHFAAYGAAIGGRDYNSVDMSDNTLWNFYLPPFKAAVDAGVSSVMNSFNDLNGVPATANSYLVRDILKGKWKFNGIVVSDWGSVGGIARHGYAAGDKEAALAAITAGCDMDMESRCYKNYLAQLVQEKKLDIKLVDEAVARVLTKKFELGLFDDPYKFSNAEREKAYSNQPSFKETARKLSRQSIVMLKNEKNTLPLKPTQKIAFIGPFAKAVRDNLGFWSMEWPDDSSTIISQFEGISEKLIEGNSLLYAKGCNINDQDSTGFEEAVNVAMQADVILLSIGEARDMSGEAKSRSNLRLPGVQEALVKRLYATGKPIVVLMNAGRPLVFNWVADHVSAILYTWWLGSEAGNAIADVVFGDYNPSGKLTMSFPRTEGQCPIYYNHLNTGHAAPSDTIQFYVTGYIDLRNSPKYPFGYGLSYSKFEYKDIKLNKKQLTSNESLTITVTLMNTSDVDGDEIVQLYIRDLVASVVRPVKELKGFQKVFLKAGESREIVFTIGEDDLKFYNRKLQYVAEPGVFSVFIGTNSRDVLEEKFTLK
jgi:beta-glucosidase